MKKNKKIKKGKFKKDAPKPIFLLTFATVAIVGGVAAGVGAIGKVAYGAHQVHKGNKDLKALEANRPKYQVNPILANNANFGFGQQATNYYTESVNRGLGSGINAILQGGGDINMINSLVGGATNAYKQYAIADAQQKLQNQGALVNDQRAAWDYNSNIPFQQKYYRSVQQTNAGAQNVAGGFQDFIGAGTSLAGMGGMGGKQEGNVQGYDYGLSGNNTYGGYVPPTNVGAPTQGYGTQFSGGQSPYGNFNPYSDIRLKENYYIVGKSNSGINIYEFSYKGNPTRYRGVMSHEVPFASILNDNGYYSVDYSQIDVNFEQL